MQIFALFCNLIALKLGQKSAKGLRITNIVKGIKFEGVWAELESKEGFQRQSVTKYLRLLHFSCKIAHYRKSLIPTLVSFLLVLTKFSFL